MLADLNAATPGTIVLLHACCHNPTGYDITPAQWDQVIAVVKAKQLVPFLDMAYQGFGNGIAIPHVRNPIIMHISQPMISLCYLENPISFNALDGKPVHTLFTIVSPSSCTHIHLLSRLSYALRDPSFMEKITERAEGEVIIGAAADIENTLAEASKKTAQSKGEIS